MPTSADRHPLRLRRRELGLSQGELARRAGVGERNIGYLEHGVTPTWPTAARVSRAVGVTPWELWPVGHDEAVAA